MFILIVVGIILTLMVSFFYYVMHLVKKNTRETILRKNLEEAEKDAKKEATHKIKHINDTRNVTLERMREFTRHE